MTQRHDGDDADHVSPATVVRADIADLANQLIDATEAEAELHRLTGSAKQISSLDEVRGQEDLHFVVHRKGSHLSAKCMNNPHGIRLDCQASDEAGLRAVASRLLMAGLVQCRWTLDASIARASAARTSYVFQFVSLS